MQFALISSCLIGINSRYDGSNSLRENMLNRLKSEYILLPVCPEQLGGLSTPRNRCEIRDKRVFDVNGNDLTDKFYKGAKEVLKIVKFYDVKIAFLKSKSPSCGYGMIYDGTFCGRLTQGNGILANLLIENGITVIPVD